MRTSRVLTPPLLPARLHLSPQTQSWSQACQCHPQGDQPSFDIAAQSPWQACSDCGTAGIGGLAGLAGLVGLSGMAKVAKIAKLDRPACLDGIAKVPPIRPIGGINGVEKGGARIGGSVGPAIFLDKDGTLLEDVPYNVDPARMRLAPGAAAGLARLGRLGLPLIVVSNQSGVAFGRFELAALERVEQRLCELFTANGARLAGCYFCPHHPHGTVAPFNIRCDCRKPAPGMLLAAAEHGVDLSASWFIGDILDDIEAGHRAGCRTILLDNGNETEWRDGPGRTPDAKVRNLDLAARLIEEQIA